MPYRGVGTSGIGNYYGKYGYDSPAHAKSILISPPDIVIEHLFGHSAIDLGNLRDGGLIQQAGGPLAGRNLLEQRERHK